MAQGFLAHHPLARSQAYTARWIFDIRHLLDSKDMGTHTGDPHFYEHNEHLTPQYLSRLCTYFARGTALTLVLGVALTILIAISLYTLNNFYMAMTPVVLLPLIPPTLLYLSWHLIHQVQMLSTRRHHLQCQMAAVLQYTLSMAAPELAEGECERLTEELMRLQPDGGLPLTTYGSDSDYFRPITYAIQWQVDGYELVRLTPGTPLSGSHVRETWALAS